MAGVHWLARVAILSTCMTVPAFAQSPPPPTARDAVSQPAQPGSRRLVEELVQRLGGAPAQPNAGTTDQNAQPGGAPIAPQPLAGQQPPVTEAAQPTVTPGADSAQPPMPDVRSLVAPAPDSGTGAPPPPAAETASPVPVTESPPPQQAAQPAAVRQFRRGGSPRQPFASDADMAKAPEMAEKMNLPRADIEVFFAFDSAEITPEATELLDMLGEAMADQRLADQKFVIAGHTDARGSHEYNIQLSQRRAEAVRQYVIDKHGIDAANLIARGFGKSRLKNPRAPQADENRRVQVINWTSQTAKSLRR